MSSQRIDLAALRALAVGENCELCGRRPATDSEWATVEEGQRDDLCWGFGANCIAPDDAKTVSGGALLALVEAVEAARRFERASQRYNYRIRDEARSALIEALAPFVLGDEEGA